MDNQTLHAGDRTAGGTGMSLRTPLTVKGDCPRAPGRLPRPQVPAFRVRSAGAKVSAFLIALICSAQVDDGDRVRYDLLLAREHIGGRLTQQERNWLAGMFRKLHPTQESTGLIPLTDLGKGLYKGEQGGLYPNGENSMPEEHR